MKVMIDTDQQTNLQQVAESQKPKKSKYSRWLSRVFVIIGFLWIGWLLWENSGAVFLQFSEESIFWITVSLVIGTISIFHNGPIFHILLNAHTDEPISFDYTSQLFFIGQMIRHMPGRFWGVVYQVNEAQDEIPSTVLVKVNIDYMMTFLVFNLLMSAAIIFYFMLHPLFAVLMLCIGIGLLSIALRFNWLHLLLKSAQKWLPQRFSSRLANYSVNFEAAYSWKRIGMLIMLLLSTWVFYLLAWNVFKLIYPSLNDINMYMLCAAYSVAWAVGFLTMITPAGLGVREAVFLFFSIPIASSTDTTFLAVFVRVWLLLIDLILFMIFWTIKFFTLGKQHAKTPSV